MVIRLRDHRGDPIRKMELPSVRVFVVELTLIVGVVTGDTVPVPAQQVVDLPALDRPLTVEYRELQRFGALTHGWDAFARVSSVAFLLDGALVITDLRSQRVTVANVMTGELLSEISKQGDGPGEIRQIHDVLTAPNGITVYDRGKMAFQVYSMNGELESYVPVGVAAREWLSPDLVASSQHLEVIHVPEVVSYSTHRPIMRLTLDGARMKSSLWAHAWRSGDQRNDSNDQFRWDPRTGGSGLDAFYPDLYLDVLPDGSLLMVDSSAYEIKVVSPASGTLSRIIRRPVPPVRLTDAIRDEEKSRRRREADTRVPPSPRELMDAYLAAIDELAFYPELSVITAIQASRAGEVWVRRRSSVDPLDENGPIDVISASGDYMGTIAASDFDMPAALGPLGLVSFLEVDERGVQIVVVGELFLEAG